MKEVNLRASGITTYGKNLSLTIGIVKNNADPMQHGRLQVYVPAYDSLDHKVEDLPWAMYVSPFGGVTANFAVGPEGEALPGISAYGFWAVPKNSAQVLIGCIDGNPDNRFWIGCIYLPEHNRTLPSGIDGVTSEIDESGLYPQMDFPHMQNRLQAAGLWKTDKHFKTRGGYERSVSHPSNKNSNKPTDNGYGVNPLESSKADSQTVSLTSPGRHAFVMSDVDEHCRIRLKTTNGQQVIFDDTNERIYISTGKGKNWIELDEGNGKIYVYSDSKISIRGKNDINLYSDENINIVANKRVHISSEERSVHIKGKHDVTLKSTHADLLLQASRDLKLKAFNGPKAPALSEETVTKSSPLDVAYRWPEKGGSDTSNIELDASQQLNMLGATGLTATSKAGIDIKSSNSSNIQASAVNVKAEGPVSFSGSTASMGFGVIKWQAGAKLNLKDPADNSLIIVEGSTGQAASASAYSGHKVINSPFMGDANGLPADGAKGAMIKPNHESWDRDEDSKWSSNSPRNAKYQG